MGHPRASVTLFTLYVELSKLPCDYNYTTFIVVVFLIQIAHRRIFRKNTISTISLLSNNNNQESVYLGPDNETTNLSLPKSG